MPKLLSGNSNLAVLPMEYSTSAVARDFIILNKFETNETEYQVIFDEKAPCASIIELIPTARKNNRFVHKVVTMLWLQKTKTIGCVKVEKIWEDPSVMQVEGVVTERGYQRFGFAMRLYESIVTQLDMTLLSDREQYAGGKHLWQKLAEMSEVLDVFILDTESACFRQFDGLRVQYDGANIPESEIWSVAPDTEMERIVLVAEAKGKR